MTTLPINQFYSGAVNTPGEAVAPDRSQGPSAAADIQLESSSMAEPAAHNGLDTGSIPVSPTTPQEAIADLLEAIGGECRFILNEEEFMAAIELPLFLRTA